MIGPLIDEAALEGMKGVLGDCIEQVDWVAGEPLCPASDRRDAGAEDGRSRRPSRQFYMSYDIASSNEALALQQYVPQGPSSSIFTNDVREAEQFMSVGGSDCGIANVNIGTFRCRDRRRIWRRKGNRRRPRERIRRVEALYATPTNTINYGNDLPLAQGIRFDIAP